MIMPFDGHEKARAANAGGHTNQTGASYNPQAEADKAIGKELKDQAHAMLEVHRELFILRCRRALLTILLERGEQGEATIDDVHKCIAVPDEVDPVAIGPAGADLARAKIIQKAGWRSTERPEAHGHPVSVWKLLSREKAVAWLAANPDRPDPMPGQVEGDPFDAKGGR